MKLYNKTKIPDAVLEPLLVSAGRAVGAKTSGVVVKVTQGRGFIGRGFVSGMAQSAAFVYAWHLWRGGGHRRISTDGGWFRIVLPSFGDSLTVAQSFFQVAMHEWAHIRDYQAGGRWTMPFASQGQG